MKLVSFYGNCVKPMNIRGVEKKRDDLMHLCVATNVSSRRICYSSRIDMEMASMHCAAHAFWLYLLISRLPFTLPHTTIQMISVKLWSTVQSIRLNKIDKKIKSFLPPLMIVFNRACFALMQFAMTLYEFCHCIHHKYHQEASEPFNFPRHLFVITCNFCMWHTKYPRCLCIYLVYLTLHCR